MDAEYQKIRNEMHALIPSTGVDRAAEIKDVPVLSKFESLSPRLETDDLQLNDREKTTVLDRPTVIGGAIGDPGVEMLAAFPDGGLGDDSSAGTFEKPHNQTEVHRHLMFLSRYLLK